MLTIELAERYTIIKILAGSHIHGLNVETSDRDEEAVVIEPMSEAFCLQKPFEELIRESPEADVKYVSLRKWCQLALKGNPNFLLPLFAPHSSILRMDARGSQLRDMKEAFISKQAIKSHLGYMQGQRERMLRQSNDGRGKPRLELVEKFGYDTKFAMHLLRLAWQGRELALTGSIVLPLPELIRQQLLDVRHGKMSLEGVLRQAQSWEEDMKIAFDTCTLPEQPDYHRVDKWMQLMYIRSWSAHRTTLDMRENREVFNVG
jgi:predicted nucleotidyltransferase